jgi:3-deoxy-D-manno-octulosonic-acid transferase
MSSGRTPAALAFYERSLAALGPFARLALRQRAASGREDAARLPERRGVATLARPDGPLVWLHVDDPERLQALLPLVERIAGRGFWALVTTGPAPSSELALDRLPDGVIHQFAPLDVPACVDRFLAHWRPGLALIAGGPSRPNLVARARARGAPAVLIDGGADDRAVLRWRRARRTLAALLGRFDLRLARSTGDAARLQALAAAPSVNVGDLRLDGDPPSADPAQMAALSAAVRGRPVMLAAALQPGEETALARAHVIARSHSPELVTIVAPRRHGQAADAAQAAELFGVVAARADRGQPLARDVEFFIADGPDELGAFYRLAHVAFAGGSLTKQCCVNPAAAAKLGAPLLHGPLTEGFADAFDALDRAEGAGVIRDADALGAEAARLLADPGARAAMARAASLTCAALGGAVDRTLAAIEPYLIQLRLGTA